jgi:hypothetical protein
MRDPIKPEILIHRQTFHWLALISDRSSDERQRTNELDGTPIYI